MPSRARAHHGPTTSPKSAARKIIDESERTAYPKAWNRMACITSLAAAIASPTRGRVSLLPGGLRAAVRGGRSLGLALALLGIAGARHALRARGRALLRGMGALASGADVDGAAMIRTGVVGTRGPVGARRSGAREAVEPGAGHDTAVARRRPRTWVDVFAFRHGAGVLAIADTLPAGRRVRWETERGIRSPLAVGVTAADAVVLSGVALLAGILDVVTAGTGPGEAWRAGKQRGERDRREYPDAPRSSHAPLQAQNRAVGQSSGVRPARDTGRTPVAHWLYVHEQGMLHPATSAFGSVPHAVLHTTHVPLLTHAVPTTRPAGLQLVDVESVQLLKSSTTPVIWVGWRRMQLPAEQKPVLQGSPF